MATGPLDKIATFGGWLLVQYDSTEIIEQIIFMITDPINFY